MSEVIMIQEENWGALQKSHDWGADRSLDDWMPKTMEKSVKKKQITKMMKCFKLALYKTPERRERIECFKSVQSQPRGGITKKNGSLKISLPSVCIS